MSGKKQLILQGGPGSSHKLCYYSYKWPYKWVTGAKVPHWKTGFWTNLVGKKNINFLFLPYDLRWTGFHGLDAQRFRWGILRAALGKTQTAAVYKPVGNLTTNKTPQLDWFRGRLSRGIKRVRVNPRPGYFLDGWKSPGDERWESLLILTTFWLLLRRKKSELKDDCWSFSTDKFKVVRFSVSYPL